MHRSAPQLMLQAQDCCPEDQTWLPLVWFSKGSTSSEINTCLVLPKPTRPLLLSGALGRPSAH